MNEIRVGSYRPRIAEVTGMVFDTMLNLEVREVDAPPESAPMELTAAVYYAGTWQGAILIECSATQAAGWAARFMPLPAPVSSEDARDGLGEITNVIAGNLKPLLPPGVGLSIPSVVEGSDYSLRILGGNRFERLRFQDDTGTFRVTLVVVDG